MQLILRLGSLRFDDSAGMGHAGGQAHQDRDPAFFRVSVGVAGHVISLLLVGRLENGNHGKGPVETGILFVLGGMHRGIVTGRHDKASVRPGHAGIDERVGTDVHTHVFHAHERTFAGVGDAEGAFHRRLFVAAPLRMDAAFPCKRMVLDEFGNFR